MMEPREIEDEGHERVLERVAAIDVAKASGMVCVRVPHESKPGRRVSRVWEVPATTRAVIELGDHLVCQGIEKVTVESASDYWRIWFYLLEAAGLDVQLVRAQDVKHLPGRPKTDTLDSVWQAKCTERGLLRPSFVPPAPIRELRDYTRLRTDLVHERTRHWSRLEKLLEDAPLTELRKGVPQFSGHVPAGVGTFPAHDRNGRSSAGSGVAGGAAAWVA
jgi:transposase